MAKFYWSVWLREKANSLVALLPRSILRGFLKTFNARPELAEAAGFHVHPRIYDSPLPLMEEIDRTKLAAPRLLPDIDVRVSSALALIEQLRPFTTELDSVPYEREPTSPFWFNNKTFTDFDAALLYAM